MKAFPITSFILIESHVCLAWSISVSNELQGRSPCRWRWYRYSSTCRLMLRTSGRRSSSCPNLSEWPGWVCIVWSIKALFTRSWVCSTCLRSSTDLTSAKQTTLTTLVQWGLFRLKGKRNPPGLKRTRYLRHTNSSPSSCSDLSLETRSWALDTKLLRVAPAWLTMVDTSIWYNKNKSKKMQWLVNSHQTVTIVKCSIAQRCSWRYTNSTHFQTLPNSYNLIPLINSILVETEIDWSNMGDIQNVTCWSRTV